MVSMQLGVRLRKLESLKQGDDLPDNIVQVVKETLHVSRRISTSPYLVTELLESSGDVFREAILDGHQNSIAAISEMRELLNLLKTYRPVEAR